MIADTGELIADCATYRELGRQRETHANAAYIVRAVNNFEMLLRTCKATLDCMEHLTTDKFSKGGDAGIRQRLKIVIKEAEKEQ